jgi:ParB family chromosome partitioning protein
MLGLLKLPNATKRLVEENKISMGHARALSKISDEELINNLADKVIAESLSVRDLERIINEENMPKKNKVIRKNTEKNIHYMIYENIMREKIGTKVKIKDRKVEIPFDSEKDLERILEILHIEITGD